MLIVKVLIMFNLGYITYQDLKKREVFWFLFPTLLILLGIEHYKNVMPIHFKNAVFVNIGLVLLIIGIQYVYNAIKIKRPFFKEVFGLGDALFFVAFAVGFSTITFIILFSCSLIFSLALWLIIKRNSLHTHAPLAGYISIFLALILLGNWITNTINLYLI